jgi:hypothetical protein
MSQTTEWEVDAWSLENDFAKIEQQWDYVRELLEEPALYGLGNPAVSGWSCGEHAGHITLASYWIADEIGRNLREPDRNVEGEWAEGARAVLEEGDIPLGAWTSPAGVHPAGRQREDLLTLVSETQTVWRGMAAKASALADCPARFPHFALGYLTSTEWVRFCAIHTAHHLSIVRKIRARSS